MSFQTRAAIASARQRENDRARAAQIRAAIAAAEEDIRRLRAELASLAPKAPGVCGKCHQHIGRGIKFHERACTGAVQ